MQKIFKANLLPSSQTVINSFCDLQRKEARTRYTDPGNYINALNGWYATEITRRIQLLEAAQKSERFRKDILGYISVRENIVDFVTDWCWTYDPRNAAIGLPTMVPFILWPKQIEYIEWVYDRYLNRERGLVEKSRDAGATWLTCLIMLREWRWENGFAGGFGSNKFDNVDEKDNTGCIFAKLRQLRDNLPEWWLPAGWIRKIHDKIGNMVNPENGSNIIGEGGEDIGRGDRRSLYVMDEAAFVEHQQAADSALSQTTDCQIDLSTPNGMNYFGRKRHSGKVQVFSFNWAQPLDAGIMTPNGLVKMGDVSVGDMAIGSDGKPTKIIGVYPQGIKKVYRVIFSDGAFTECCADHLWSVITSGDQREERKHIHHVISLSEIMNNYVEIDGRGFKRHNYQIPIASSVEFSSRVLPINPYVLGTLLGDGSLPKITSRPIILSLSRDDKEIADLVNDRLPKCCSIKYDGGLQYRISTDISTRGGELGRGWHNPVNKIMRELKLSGSQSHTKFIPELYKLSSSNERLELLQGLMDTDGSIDRSNPGIARLTTVSRQLADDVVFLVQTLGGVASIYKQPDGRRIFPGNRECECKERYQVSARLPNHLMPFKLSRKVNAYNSGTKYKVRRSLVKIEMVGEKKCQCIKVESQNSLYLTDACIVTHNTDDPRKSEEWYNEQKASLDQTIVAQEIDIDYRASAGKLIWPEWADKVKHVATARKFPHLGITLDHGHAHPTAVIFWYYDPYTPLLYIWGEYWKTMGYPTDHAPEIWAILMGNKPDIQIADSAIFADTGKDKLKPTVESEYRALGFDFERSGAKPGEKHRIIRTGIWIKNGWIQVHPSCAHFNQECQEWFYDQNGKPVDKKNEGPDILNYTVERLETKSPPVVNMNDINYLKNVEAKQGWRPQDKTHGEDSKINKFWKG